LYFEPFVAYIPENHRDFHKEEIEVADLNLDEILFITRWTLRGWNIEFV
jgi:LysR family hydrogen peroxide-inducible transcriptional activator